MTTAATIDRAHDITTATARTSSRAPMRFMVMALMVSVASCMLNASMLSPAIRDINAHLGPHGYASMSTYFHLSSAICTVVLIRWSDYIDRKRLLIAVLVVQCFGSLLCITGTSLTPVVVGRILQGGSNITFGLAYLIMRERLSAVAFGVCCGVLSAVNAGVAGLDALLGGFLVDHFGFRSIFMLTLAVGAGAVALSWKAVPAIESDGARTGRMDWMGAALIALGVAAINLFLTNGGHAGWFTPDVLAFFTAAIVALVAFVAVEKRAKHPLANIDALRSRYAWPVIAVTVLSVASFFVVLSYIVPSIAEDDHVGFSANAQMTALLFITPVAAAKMIVAPFIGRLGARIGFVTVLRAGLIGAVAVTVLLAIFAFNRTMVILLLPLFGAAMAASITPLSVLGVIQAPKNEPGSLPGIANAGYGIGNSIGFTWAGPIVGLGTNAGFESALWICVAIGAVALLVSMILKPRPLAVEQDM